MTEAHAPVARTVRVAAPRERAFEVFTAGMSRWWNPSHSIGASPWQAVVLEPREGGRWFERAADGAECDWGRVLVWEPPSRLVLSWQIDSSWRYDPALVTEVELRFEPEGPDATRVTLEHRNLDRFGAQADAVRAALDSPGGWSGLLDRFEAAAGARA